MTLSLSFPLWVSVSSSEKWEQLHLLYRIVVRTEYDTLWLIVEHANLIHFTSLSMNETKEVGGKDPDLESDSGHKMRWGM